MKDKELEHFMNFNKMVRHVLSKIPTWVDEQKTEGIELVAGKFQSFWLKKNLKDNSIERVYGEPAGQKIQRLLDELSDEKSDQQNDKQAEPQQNEIKKSEAHELPDENNVLLPELLTSALISRWAKMSTTDRVLMFQKTPKDKIKSVVIGKDEKGVQQRAPYVEGNFMFKEANAAFLFDWYLDNVVLTVCPTGVSCTGRLYCWFSEYNKYLSRPAVGYQEINKKVDHEMAKKGATTDAIKKGLSLFGFNLDVYGGDV